MRIPHLAFIVLFGCHNTAENRPTPSMTVPHPSEQLTSEPQPAAPAQPPEAVGVMPSDVAQGVEFTIEPAGIALEAHDRFVGYLDSGRSLSQVQSCDPGWDSQFSKVANAALPFDKLVLQTGPQRFCGGASYLKLELRVYLLDEAVDAAASGAVESPRASSRARSPRPAEQKSMRRSTNRILRPGKRRWLMVPT